MKILAVSEGGGLGIAPIAALAYRGVEFRRLALSELRTRRFGGISRKLDKYLPGGNLRRSIEDAIDTFRPDIIHLEAGRPSALAVISAVGRSRPVPIVMEHGAIQGLNILGPFDWATFFNRRITRLVVPSTAVINHWAGQPLIRHAIGIERCHAIPHSYAVPADVDAQQRQELRRQLGFRPDEFVVGTVCANRTIKNLAFVAEVVRRLGPPFVFAHIGSHRPESIRRKLVAAGGDRLRLIARRPDAAHVNAAFDLFVTPTRLPGESFGLAPVEAMANRVPVVTGVHGGTAQIVEDGISGLTLPLVHDQWMDAIGRLSKQPDRIDEMGRAARQRIAERFNPDINAERFIALYQSILSTA